MVVIFSSLCSFFYYCYCSFSVGAVSAVINLPVSKPYYHGDGMHINMLMVGFKTQLDCKPAYTFDLHKEKIKQSKFTNFLKSK